MKVIELTLRGKKISKKYHHCTRDTKNTSCLLVQKLFLKLLSFIFRYIYSLIHSFIGIFCVCTLSFHSLTSLLLWVNPTTVTESIITFWTSWDFLECLYLQNSYKKSEHINKFTSDYYHHTDHLYIYLTNSISTCIPDQLEPWEAMRYIHTYIYISAKTVLWHSTM